MIKEPNMAFTFPHGKKVCVRAMDAVQNSAIKT